MEDSCNMNDEKRQDEDRRYRVVDRRGKFADDEPAAGPEKNMGREEAAPPPRDDSRNDEAPENTPEPKIEDAIKYSLGIIREQVLFALGLIMSKNRISEPDYDRVKEVVRIFSDIAGRFADPVFSSGADEAMQPPPSLSDAVAFCFNLIQGQTYMHLGLIANPVTGEAKKDIAQAKVGVDFCDAILESARPALDPDTARKLGAMVADLKINFVKNK
jgi:hypothetical protein